MKKILVLNHKSYLTLKKAQNYCLQINDYIRGDQTVIICPSNIYLPYFKGKYNFELGSQNISHQNITGEITGNLLKDSGVKYSLIGHGERKETLNEGPKEINLKIKEAHKNNITPIVIIGENFYQYKMKKSGEIITKQIKDYLKDIEIENNLIIAYEPNWDITKNEFPALNHIKEITKLIKTITKRKYNRDIKILYGGNVALEKLPEINKINTIDGYLIGKLSTEVKEIKQIFDNTWISSTKKAKKSSRTYSFFVVKWNCVVVRKEKLWKK